MLKVDVKGGNIDTPIKEMRRKVVGTKLIKQLRDNKQFTKPSVKRRAELLKAQYVQKKREEEEY
jgi:small subunit ribosomal protein S21